MSKTDKAREDFWVLPREQPAPATFRQDERTLIAIIGVGIIAALLIDAVAHSAYSAKLSSSVHL